MHANISSVETNLITKHLLPMLGYEWHHLKPMVKVGDTTHLAVSQIGNKALRDEIINGKGGIKEEGIPRDDVGVTGPDGCLLLLHLLSQGDDS